MGEHKMGLVGATSLILLNLAGTGMFFGPALSASYAGTAALIVWIWMGLQSIYVGMILSELVSLHPKSGGIYEFAKQAYGQFVSFLVGWVMWLVSTVTISILIVSALLYAFPDFIEIPWLLMFWSLIILITLSLIAYKGLGESEAILDMLALLAIIFIIITILWGAPYINTSNYTPFFPTHPIMLFVALFFILEAYFGWEAVTFMAEEVHEPQKTIPRALTISTIASSTLGIIFAFVIFGIIGAQTLAGSQTPLLDIFVLLFGETGGFILRTGVFLSLTGSAAGVIISGPRLLSAMARDKLFIEQFSVKSPKTGTPARAILFQCIVASGVIFFALGQYELLLSVLVPLALIMYILVFLTLPILRVKQPGPRLFSCPFPFVGPFIVCAVFLGCLISWIIVDPNSLGILMFSASLVFFGAPIYLLLSVYYNPTMQVRLSSFFSYPTYLLENLMLPKKIRHIIIHFFSDINGKTVLEMGSGVGSLTMHLADEVTSKGRVIAIDSSAHNIRIVSRRIRRKKHTHVVLIHDQEATSRVHPTISSIDAVFSVGLLGYIQDRPTILKQLAQLMPENGHICFMEWVDYFNVLPNPAGLAELNMLQREFIEAGFSVNIIKIKGWFWSYLIIRGIKSKHPVPFI